MIILSLQRIYIYIYTNSACYNFIICTTVYTTTIRARFPTYTRIMVFTKPKRGNVYVIFSLGGRCDCVILWVRDIHPEIVIM